MDWIPARKCFSPLSKSPEDVNNEANLLDNSAFLRGSLD